MEFRGVYIIWGLLPFGYLCLTTWVYLRPLFKVAGREKAEQYYPSLLWTGGCFILALILDHFGLMDALFSLIRGTGLVGPELQIELLRILLYPGVLVGVAQIQKIMTGEDSDRKRNLPKSKWR